MDKKIFKKFKTGFNLIDMDQINPITPSEFLISFSVESYDKRNC